LSCPNVAPSTKKNSSFVCENIPGNKTVSDSDSESDSDSDCLLFFGQTVVYYIQQSGVFSCLFIFATVVGQF